MRGVVWLRRDLRLQDQPALTAACAECDEVIPLFRLRRSHLARAATRLALCHLHGLLSRGARWGPGRSWACLTVAPGNYLEEVVRFVADVKADVVYWNRDYEPVGILRDRKVQQALIAQNVAVRTFKAHVVFEAEEIRGSTGNPLQRYSAYRTRWWAKWHAAPPRPCLPPLSCEACEPVPQHPGLRCRQ